MTPEATAPTDVIPVNPLVAKHKLRFIVIGVFNLVFGVYALILFVAFTAVSHGLVLHAGAATMIVSRYLLFFSCIVTITAGISLLLRKRWGRMAAIVAAITVLFLFPIGTVFGVIFLILLSLKGSADIWNLISSRA